MLKVAPKTGIDANKENCVSQLMIFKGCSCPV
jgi:hypothetical protein